MRRKREPGTRKPLSCPLSKQRMMVCWLTLQILAASPVVKTVFMGTSTPPNWPKGQPNLWFAAPFSEKGREPKSSLICLFLPLLGCWPRSPFSLRAPGRLLKKETGPFQTRHRFAGFSRRNGEVQSPFSAASPKDDNALKQEHEEGLPTLPTRGIITTL